MKVANRESELFTSLNNKSDNKAASKRNTMKEELEAEITRVEILISKFEELGYFLTADALKAKLLRYKLELKSLSI